MVLLALIEPKQFESVFLGVPWLYPANLFWLAITVFYLVTRKRMPHFPRKLYGTYLAFAIFAGAYLLTSTVNLCLESSADTSLMINGVGRVILQYLIGPPLILCTLSYIFRTQHWKALHSFVIPSVLAIAAFLATILLVIFAGGVGVPPPIREEIITQAWVPVGSLVFFIPKWGVTYAESQEFGFFLFLSFLLVDIYRERGTHAHHRKYHVLALLYFIFILWTASKGVFAGMCVYLLLRNKRHIQIKSAALAASFVLLACYLSYSMAHDPVTFMNNALSSTSLDGRVFPVVYFVKNAAAHPLHLLFGFGARQYGTMVSRDYPSAFIKFTTPVSMFGVVTDSGLIGLACYLAMMAAIWLSLRGYRARLAVIAAFIADLWLPDWSMDAYILFLLIVLFACREDREIGELTGLPKRSLRKSPKREWNQQ